MSISYKNLKKYAFAYMTMPLFVFVLGFVKWYISIPMSLIMAYSLFFALKDKNTYQKRDNVISLSKREIFIVMLVLLLWTYLGGMNGFYYQSSDWDCRNAIYHDLIEKSWPVIYSSKNSALVYYIGFWLPSAALTKFIGLFGLSTGALWVIGKVLLWIWGTIGVLLTLMLLFCYLNTNKKAMRSIVLLMFIFFSGMDILGMKCLETGWYWLQTLHLEWWSFLYQFSSNTTCLFWVFNQTIISWLAVICFLFEKSPKNYLIIGLSCFISGPFPFVGLVLCMILRGVEHLIESAKEKQVGAFVKEVFSRPNILLTLFVFPVAGAYFVSNTSVGNTSTYTVSLFERLQEYLELRLLIFLVFEVGIYLLLVWKEHKRELLFYGISILFAIIPFVKIGSSYDFCMRGSIPLLFILMIYCMEIIVENVIRVNKKDLCAILLICLLLVGAVTPGFEFYRGFDSVKENGTVLLEDDPIKTVEAMDGAYNFSTQDYSDKLFFKYFAK